MSEDQELERLGLDIHSALKDAIGAKDERMVIVLGQLGMLVSRFRSEERSRIRHERDIDLLNKAIFGSKENPNEAPGMIHCLRRANDKIDVVQETIDANRRMQKKVMSGIVGLVLLEVCKMAFAHMKP